MMGRYLVSMRYLINIICIALLLWGCDSANGGQAKPTVVRKKIVAPKDNIAQVRAKKAIRTAKMSPPDKQLEKTAVAKVDRNQIAPLRQSTAETNPSTEPMVAQKQEAKPIENDTSKPAARKKPAISPKSDITEIEPAAETQRQPGNVQPAPDSKSAASNKVAPDKLVTQNVPAEGTPAKYDPSGRIDPFEPLFKEEAVVATAKLQHKKRIPRTPLERIDLSQLKLVGIIMAASGNRALVEESSGKGYVIKEGTYIGTNGGKIVSIHKETVTVEEELEDVYGKLTIRKKELKLPKPPGEF
jgi:type IV pilus assembly protein PilP